MPRDQSTSPGSFAAYRRIIAKVLTVHTKTRVAFVNLTPEGEAAVRESCVREGMMLVKIIGE